MKLDVRRWFTLVDERAVEAGQRTEQPLRKVAAVVILGNPYAGRYVDDLSEGVEASKEVGAFIAKLAVEAMGPHKAESYGKGGVVGLGGELEHANALLTSTFAEPVRAALGGGLSWVPSFTKVGAPGVRIDVPLAHKDALYVRSHYDGMTISMPDESPAADELALIIVLANRGRLNARVGGLQASQISKRDGLY
ncbi:amino acid synthesis family protein [Roseomonas sp. WA12]